MKKTLVIILCSALLSFLAIPLQGAIPASERAALIALYNSTNGDSWNNNSGWKTPPLDADGFAMPGTEAGWYGISVDPSPFEHVFSISLSGKNLAGPLPAQLEDLTLLTHLDLGWNSLSDSIPSEIGNLTFLGHLQLNNNALNGTIPTSLGNLTSLNSLQLHNNQLTGAIPSQIGSCSALNTLYLYGNQLTDTIPVELGNLSNLTFLSLGSNQLSGAIPASLGNLTQLNYLYLGYNSLTGSIPTELGNLYMVTYFHLGHNQLSGTIPTSLKNLTLLQALDLTDNQLTGSIPVELGQLANLTSLGLTMNQLTGSIPAELGNLANLQQLWIQWNSLGGGIPASLGNLKALTWLALNNNQLTDPIPAELGGMTNLVHLWLDGNQLSGSIPAALGSLANLEELFLSDNRLSGLIPSELGSLSSLTRLILDNNALQGPIPLTLLDLTNLYISESDLDYNALFTPDDTLLDFLESKTGGEWSATQTVAPWNIQAAPVNGTTVKLTWDPIQYDYDTGGYRVFIGTTAGGPYEYFDITDDKTASSMQVSGLTTGQPYYFVIQTRTNPTADNQNTVDSVDSEEVSATPIDFIKVTAPNGGESWPRGSLRNITWDFNGLSGNVRLVLFRNLIKVGVIATVPVTQKSYGWAAGTYIGGTAVAAKNYKIKAVTVDGVYADWSDANFTLTLDPFVQVLTPNGGESWAAGSVHAITWTSRDVAGNVRLVLYNDGTKVGAIATLAVSAGSYNWTVGNYVGGTAPEGTRYYIKIVSTDGVYQDFSDSAFAIMAD